MKENFKEKLKKVGNGAALALKGFAGGFVFAKKNENEIEKIADPIAVSYVNFIEASKDNKIEKFLEFGSTIIQGCFNFCSFLHKHEKELENPFIDYENLN